MTSKTEIVQNGKVRDVHRMGYSKPLLLRPIRQNPRGIPVWVVCQHREMMSAETSFRVVTDLQGPPSERTQTEKIRDLKSLARQYARDRGSCDDTRISYLEFMESEAEADLTLARMIAG
jgi:hypothetical protein